MTSRDQERDQWCQQAEALLHRARVMAGVLGEFEALASMAADEREFGAPLGALHRPKNLALSLYTDISEFLEATLVARAAEVP